MPRQEIASQPAARCGVARPCERPGLRAAQRSYRPRAPADMKRRCGGTASAQLVGQIGIGRRMAGREIDSRTVMARFKLTHGDLAHRQSSGIAVRTIAQCKTQSSARCFFWVGDERPVRLALVHGVAEKVKAFGARQLDGTPRQWAGRDGWARGYFAPR